MSEVGGMTHPLAAAERFEFYFGHPPSDASAAFVIEKLRRPLETLERALESSGGLWLTPPDADHPEGRFTAADLHVADMLRWSRTSKPDGSGYLPGSIRDILDKYPRTDEWLTRCLDRPLAPPYTPENCHMPGRPSL